MLALTRQNLPQLRTELDSENRCAAGAYEIVAADGDNVDVSIFATGSEVSIAVEAAKILNQQGQADARGVGAVLRIVRGAARRGPACRIIGGAEVNVAVEAAVRQGWDAIIGSDGVFVGMSGFGASAPLQGPLQAIPDHAGGGRVGGLGQAQRAVSRRSFRLGDLRGSN